MNTPVRLFLGWTLEWNTTEIVFATNGAGLNQVNHPYSIFIPPTGDILYIADTGNHRILRWPLNASSSTIIAGGQGSGSNASLLYIPSAVYVDRNGSMVVSDSGNYRAQYFASGSLVGYTVAGNGAKGVSNTQIGEAIGGIAIDYDNNVYISEWDNNRVAKWAPNATYGILAAGGGTPGKHPKSIECSNRLLSRPGI